MIPKISRLSESMLWQLQHNAYTQFGIESWTRVGVPFHITNNARIAKQYAEIAHAAMKGVPMTILEIGGGSGKFAFLFLSELSALTDAPFQYVLTDCAEKNVAFWNSHPFFTPWIRQGVLRTAVYDPLVSPPFPWAPNLVIANYFFDTVPQDLFRVEKSALLEGMISLSKDDARIAWDDPAVIPHLQDDYSFRPLDTCPYLDDDIVCAILEDYRCRFEKISFFFPAGAFRALGRLQRFCKKQCLFLMADRGVCEEKELLSQTEPRMSRHGTFSFPVNFHAIGQWMRRQGGEMAFSKDASSDFAVTMGSMKPMSDAVRSKFLEQTFGSLNVQNIQDLEAAHWDPTLFFSAFDKVQEWFAHASDAEKLCLEDGMRRVRERFFPLFREESVLLEQLGLFWQSLGDEEEARLCFERAALGQGMRGLGVNARVLLDAERPAGVVLQIGAMEGMAKKVCSWTSWKSVPLDLWEADGIFDTIYFLAPQSRGRRKNKPGMVQEIEKQFAFLETIVYSDEDLEVLIAHLERGEWVSKGYIREFLIELKRKNNVSAEQLVWVMQRLQDAGILETSDAREISNIGEVDETLFFETLQRCLKRHMKPGSIFRAILSKDSSPSDDPKVFDQMIVNPHLHYEESLDDASQLLIITVKLIDTSKIDDPLVTQEVLMDWERPLDTDDS